jgi:hypothetical protein
MSPLVIADTYEVTQHFSLTGGEEMVNVFHIYGSGAGGNLNQSAANAIGDAVFNAWNDNLKGVTYTGNSFDTVKTKDISTANGPAFEKAFTTSGTNGSDPLPNGVTSVVTWRTGSTGRSFRGRSYIGGFTEGSSTGNSPSITLTGDLNGWAQDLIDNIDALTFALSVASRVLEEVNPITSFVVRSAWHSQRRRNLKG